MRYYYIVIFKTLKKNHNKWGQTNIVLHRTYIRNLITIMSCWIKFKMLFIIFLTLLHILHTTIGAHEVDI